MIYKKKAVLLQRRKFNIRFNSGHEKMVNFLIKNSANVNFASFEEYGDTLLLAAAAHGKFQYSR